MISAPSGAGKTTLLQRLLGETEDLEFSVSCTTRPPRPGEVDGRDYYFITEEAFERHVAAGDFLEWAVVHGHRYGTSRRFVEEAWRRGKDVILDVDVQGALQVRRRMPEAILIFILPPSRAELERRLRHRGTDSEEVIRQRLRNAAGEVEHVFDYDYVIINRDLEVAAGDLQAVVRACRSRRDRRRQEAEAVVATFREA
ncbi:MAG: guanylate kinase [Acidobacteriota bacterium]